MSARAEKLLQASGIHEPLIGSIERGEALFVLSSGTLLYQDSSGTRRVTLRDLTRIHSDQEGLLRVETPAGTALTASLLGFDPVDVQSFFGQVRDTTARVKQIAPAAQASAQPAPQPAARPAAAPVAPMPSAAPTRPPEAGTGTQETVRVVSPAGRDPAIPKVPTMVIPAPATTPEVRQPPAATPEPRPVPEPRNPTLITTPAPPRPQAPATPPQTPLAVPVVVPKTGKATDTAVAVSPQTGQARAEPGRIEAGKAEQAGVEPVKAEPVKVEPVKADAPSTAAPRLPQTAAGTLAALAANAAAVRAWVGRLRFLAALMFLAALALAFLQMQGGSGLSGIWVLIAGGMSAVALLALADLTKLLVSLASAVSAEGGVMDVD